MQKLPALATAVALSAALVFAPAQAVAGDLAQVVDASEAVAPAGEQAAIGEGHVDIGPQVADGQAELLARDDTAEKPTWRHGEDVVYQVGDAALQTLPEGDEFAFVGAGAGEKVWVVPQTEVAGVPWIGWNTQAPSLVDAADRGVHFSFLGHQGPGEFSLFLQNGGFEPPQLLWSTVKKGEDDLWVDLNTHTHANWTFTEPGVHHVGLRVTIPTKDGQELTADHVLTFAVGSQTTVDEAHASQWDASQAQAGPQATAWWVWAAGAAVLIALIAAVVALRARAGKGGGHA